MLAAFLPAQDGGAFGLTSSECISLTEVIYKLIIRGHACGVGDYQDDGVTYSFVLDSRGESYVVGRHAGVYFLLDPEFGLVTLDRHFESVLQTLADTLGSKAHSATERLTEGQACTLGAQISVAEWPRVFKHIAKRRWRSSI